MAHRSFRTVISLSLAAVAAMALAACGDAPSGRVKSVGTGETWGIGETVDLSKLALAEGCAVTAGDGHSLTMTVDGVEAPITPGAYAGNIVLEVK